MSPEDFQPEEFAPLTLRESCFVWSCVLLGNAIWAAVIWCI